MTAMGKTWKKDKTGGNFSKNKKSKFTKGEKKEFKPPNKRGRLVLRNLPFKCNEDDLLKHLSSFGEIRDINLLRRPDKKLVGCGFVEFVSRLDADKAIENLNGKPFLGRPIYIDRAVARDNYNETSKDEESAGEEDESTDRVGKETDSEINKDDDYEDESKFDVSNVKHEWSNTGDEYDDADEGYRNKHSKYSKQRENSKNEKKGRLIIRNLSFKSSEEKLKEHFAQFGEVMEVKLLRKPDKSLVGCGFVQFAKKLSAAKAIHHTSGKPFLGRPIIVDWAVSKDRFEKMQEEAVKKEIKEEDDNDEDTKSLKTSKAAVKKEEQSDEESEEDSKEDSEESEEEEDDDDDDESEDNEAQIKQESDQATRQRRDDIDEGKTVFVKNLPFSATNEEFKKCIEQFGPVFYAVICKDKLTEHSRGSGFVKFKNKEDAEKCLSAGTELTLNGNILDPHPALKRMDAQKLQDKTKVKKDNRNLYLVKEGMIIAGTPAAKGVSVSDMERRLQLEQWKTAKLRNLNMFVSPNRLVIQNLPPNSSDKQLRKLFKKYSGPKSVISEAKVMRDLKHVDAAGKSASKGYGFVSFESHEDALRALRVINNNPNIFTSTARPIVAFSIENRGVLNQKAKRVARSRQKNPLCKDYKPEETDETPTKKRKLVSREKVELRDEPDYAGIEAKPGSTVKMRQKFKLKNQAAQHVQDVRKEKRDLKFSRKVRRTEHVKQKQVEKKLTKKKKKTVDNDVAFTKLVDKYKTTILSHKDKKKWYDN